jgi:hypothetical protein
VVWGGREGESWLVVMKSISMNPRYLASYLALYSLLGVLFFTYLCCFFFHSLFLFIIFCSIVLFNFINFFFFFFLGLGYLALGS